jgi:hypothetical protein
LPDAFAYALASARGWTLLTGDGKLRALAQAQQVPFFGVLWVLDQLFDGQMIEVATIVPVSKPSRPTRATDCPERKFKCDLSASEKRRSSCACCEIALVSGCQGNGEYDCHPLALKASVPRRLMIIAFLMASMN